MVCAGIAYAGIKFTSPGSPGGREIVAKDFSPWDEGSPRGGSCSIDSDCNDWNDCTNDVCIVSICTHTNVLAGTACGSTVDTTCTDPDTCDASGHCQANDVANGTDCNFPGGCRGGECAHWLHYGSQLPEGGFQGSEVCGAHPGGFSSALVVGRVTGGGLGHAAAWHCETSNPPTCTLVQLPEGAASTSLANAAACHSGIAECMAVGATGSPPQPAIWSYSTPNWTSESVPLPAGSTGGSVVSADSFYVGAGTRVAAGQTVNSSGFRKATYWTRSAGGVWTEHVLTDYGSGRESAARDLIQCSGGGPICVASNVLLISGWAEDTSGVIQPVIWRESGAFSGQFTMHVLPLPGGATGIAQQFPTANEDYQPRLGFVDHSAFVDKLYVFGTVEMVNGTTRGVAWRTVDFIDEAWLILPPLAGYDNSIATGGAAILDLDSLMVWGSFVPMGGNPLTDGYATQWTLDASTLALTSGPTDMNTIVAGIPSGCHATSFADISRDVDAFFNSFIAVYVCPSAAAARGTPQPHAAIAVAEPAVEAPVVSTLGVAVMVVLMLSAGTIVVLRRRRVTAR
jgi:hypothetical protein